VRQSLAGRGDLSVWDDQRYPFRLVTQREGGRTSGFSFEAQRETTSHSLSGNEHNRLFLSRGGNFDDLTLLSGADDLHDGRSFAQLDYDRDGWLDIALMGLNAPRFRLLRNTMGDRYPDRSSMTLWLEGRFPESNREAIGAVVTVRSTDGSRYVLQRQSGQGFASQNSAGLRIPRNPANPAQSLEIRWPSGAKSEHSVPSRGLNLQIREPRN
jgi:hypothetical protein